MKIFKHNYYQVILTLIIVAMTCSCDKQNDWLDIKSNKASVVPETIKDFQAILDNTTIMNGQFSSAGLVGADNIYINDTNLGTLTESERNLYTWNKQVWQGGLSYDWNFFYSKIEFANIAIEGLGKINVSELGYDNLKGQAYFHRAMAYYNLAQLFCKPYNPATATSDLGLPIRKTSDVNILVQRSSLKELYNLIIADGLTAERLLNESQTYLQRPSKSAAQALIAKIYFIMGDYVNTVKYTDLVIANHNTLLDYNNSSLVSSAFAYKFPPDGKNNPEILFFAKGDMYSSLNALLSSPGYVNPDLYQTYDGNDLRKSTLYGGTGTYKNLVASYTGSYTPFCGLAINETYLIRAESKAREGDKDGALKDLNTLLVKRFKTGTFTDLNTADAEGALRLILMERRKELPEVGNLRWEDLRRLNGDTRFQTTIKRTVNNVVIELPPNDPRYVLPIPDQEIQISGLEQNPR
nr:RagB/SusD family nutrient uptake outer membrane protein [Mucilaginibacter sp. L294]